ncbi:Di-copper centre-containing protein, partial [Conidiobolus coronatus NRRL 28638]
FAQRHVQYFGSIHGAAMFFPWHRVYLADLERLLRTKDPKVRIPFWDWTQYYNNRNNDPIWQWFGKEGNRNRQNCVTTGVFSNFIVYYGPSMNERPSNRCFTRSPNPGTTFGCSRADFTVNVIDQKDTKSFWEYMENNCHNSVHSAIGGGFSDLISTNDPLFFSHHAFVDAAWFLRQMRHP